MVIDIAGRGNNNPRAEQLVDANDSNLGRYAERDSFTLYEAAMLAYGKDPGFFNDQRKGLRTFTNVRSLYFQMLEDVKIRRLAACCEWSIQGEVDGERTTIAREAFEAYRQTCGRRAQPLPGADATATVRQGVPADIPVLGVRKQQETNLLAHLEAKYKTVSDLPRGSKAETKRQLMSERKFTESTFDATWKRLSTSGQIGVSGKEKYTKSRAD